LGIGMLIEIVSFNYAFYFRTLTYLTISSLVYLKLK